LELKTLTVEDVLAIHETLVSDFAATGDPISPPGVKSLDLLHSAVHRQHTGYEGKMKYPDPVREGLIKMRQRGDSLVVGLSTVRSVCLEAREP
jgi:death-on-curing protein